MTEPIGFVTVSLLLERLITEVQGLRSVVETKTVAPAAMQAEPEGLWDAGKVAAYLACSKSWVYDAEATGKLPSLHIGGMLRFEPEAIRRLARGEQSGAKVVPLNRSSK